MRTGKTLTSLVLAKEMGCGKILFVTRKKAIDSIISDVVKVGNLDVEVVNYESLHKVSNNSFDAVILDEAHCLGGYPKPAQRVNSLKKKMAAIMPKYVIYLSGTPFPESYSQIYHQLFILPFTHPFSSYNNFYHWARHFVDVREKRLPHGIIKDYSMAKRDKIKEIISPYFVSLSQSDAWNYDVKFEVNYLRVFMSRDIHAMLAELARDKIIRSLEYVANTAAKEFTAYHQLASGTLKNDGKSIILDTSKCEMVRKIVNLHGKVVVFYKYIAEGEALRKYFLLNNDVVLLQLQAGSEGHAVPDANAIVFYNVDFSNRTHLQARQRITYKGRRTVFIYYLLSDIGFEENVLKVLTRKEKYNIRDFYKFKKMQL
ncbi:MAG: DEAD/DEAH box helicase family protein [candidate division WOR-3 bacterium]